MCNMKMSSSLWILVFTITSGVLGVEVNVGELLNSNAEDLSRATIEKLNDLLHFVDTTSGFGIEQLKATSVGINKAISTNLAEIDKLLNVAASIGYNVDHCSSHVDELKALPEVAAQQLEDCATQIRSVGKTRIQEGITTVQKLIVGADVIKANIKECQKSGYDVSCALPIYATTSGLIFQTNLIDGRQAQLFLQGEIEIDQCSNRAIEGVIGKITDTVNCLLQ